MSAANSQQPITKRCFSSKDDALKYYSDHIVAEGSRWRVLKADIRRIHLTCKSEGCSASVKISIRTDGSAIADEAGLHHGPHANKDPAPLLAHVDNVVTAVLKEAPNISMAHYYSIISALLRCSVNRKVLWRARRRIESQAGKDEDAHISNLQD